LLIIADNNNLLCNVLQKQCFWARLARLVNYGNIEKIGAGFVVSATR